MEGHNCERGLKWSNGSSEDIIIRRFTKSQDSAHIISWMKSVKETIPISSTFLDFVAVTGIRFVEAINSYNLIIDLKREGRLLEYYNAGRELLEHYKFKDIFMRKGKKVFISFVSRDLIERISNSNKLTKITLENRIKRSGLTLRFGDVREYWASYMTKHLRQPEIDFCQGRISTSVFMRNYFNPAWIGDLKDRALRGENELANAMIEE